MFNVIPTSQVPLLKKLFPSYRKRKINIKYQKHCILNNLNWDSGSINEYSIVDLRTYSIKSLKHLSLPHPADNTHENAKLDITEDIAIIKTGVFMGKPSTMTVYMHPNVRIESVFE